MFNKMETINGIFKYTNEAQKILKSKTKPEPWLHVGFAGVKSNDYMWHIWVWDTRDVIEQGTVKLSKTPRDTFSSPAVDNKKPLKGGDTNFKFDSLYVGGTVGRYGGVWSVKVGPDKDVIMAHVNRAFDRFDSNKAKSKGTWPYTVQELKPAEFVHAVTYGLLPSKNQQEFFDKNKSAIVKAIRLGFRFNRMVMSSGRRHTAHHVIEKAGGDWQKAVSIVHDLVSKEHEKNKKK